MSRERVAVDKIYALGVQVLNFKCLQGLGPLMQTKIRVRFYIQRFIADVCKKGHFKLVNVCFCSVSATTFVSGSM